MCVPQIEETPLDQKKEREHNQIVDPGNNDIFILNFSAILQICSCFYIHEFRFYFPSNNLFHNVTFVRFYLFRWQERYNMLKATQNPTPNWNTLTYSVDWKKKRKRRPIYRVLIKRRCSKIRPINWDWCMNEWINYCLVQIWLRNDGHGGTAA